MGVQAIWEATQGATDHRVPFTCFAVKFFEENKRPLRVAVDGYQWLVEASSNLPRDILQKARQGKIVQVFHSRVRYLISLNVSFVIVFDGGYKPKFKRREISTTELQNIQEKDYDLYYKEIINKLEKYQGDVYDLPDVIHVKRMLNLWKVEYVEAPADDEAECARLQQLGIVDYVISNDSDTLSFGATQVLRNFSKFEEDKPAGASGGYKNTADWWVTPVRLEQVKAIKGFDTDRFILLSLLCGADYSSGILNLGAIRASQICLCGTSKMIEHSATFPYDTLPDFSKELASMYRNMSVTGSVRTKRYNDFQKRIFDLAKRCSGSLFGRNEVQLTATGDNFSGWPPEFVVSLYYRPITLPQSRTFQFAEGTTNNASSQTRNIFCDVDFEQLYSFIQEYPHGTINDLSKWFFHEMSAAYMLRFLRSDRKTGWQDDGHFKFVKVRMVRFGAEERDENGIFIAVFKALSHGLPPLCLSELYIDPQINAPNFNVPVDLLPEETANCLYGLERDRLESIELKKSPKKPSPRKNAEGNNSPNKRSPRKPKLGLNSSPTTKLTQSTLSPKKPATQVQMEVSTISPDKPTTQMRRQASTRHCPLPLLTLPTLVPNKSNDTLETNDNPFYSRFDTDDSQSKLGHSPTKTKIQSPVLNPTLRKRTADSELAINSLGPLKRSKTMPLPSANDQTLITTFAPIRLPAMTSVPDFITFPTMDSSSNAMRDFNSNSAPVPVSPGTLKEHVSNEPETLATLEIIDLSSLESSPISPSRNNTDARERSILLGDLSKLSGDVKLDTVGESRIIRMRRKKVFSMPSATLSFCSSPKDITVDGHLPASNISPRKASLSASDTDLEDLHKITAASSPKKTTKGTKKSPCKFKTVSLDVLGSPHRMMGQRTVSPIPTLPVPQRSKTDTDLAFEKPVKAISRPTSRGTIGRPALAHEDDRRWRRTGFLPKFDTSIQKRPSIQPSSRPDSPLEVIDLCTP